MAEIISKRENTFLPSWLTPTPLGDNSHPGQELSPAPEIKPTPAQNGSGDELDGESRQIWQDKLETYCTRAIETLLEGESTGAKAARGWLEQRGITAKSSAHFGIGFNDSWRHVVKRKPEPTTASTVR